MKLNLWCDKPLALGWTVVSLFSQLLLRGQKKGRDMGFTHAVQKEADDTTMVALRNLRVMLVQDGKYWFAQGMEIDYAAQGLTLEEAKNNFALGLKLTVRQHLIKYSSIDRLVKGVSPQVAFDMLSAAAAHGFRFSQVSRHDLVDLEELRNRFAGIEYLKAAA